MERVLPVQELNHHAFASFPATFVISTTLSHRLVVRAAMSGSPVRGPRRLPGNLVL